MDEIIAILKDSGIQHKQDLDFLAVSNTLAPYFDYYRFVKKLLPNEKWEYYKLVGITGLREQNLLDEAKRNLRRAWKATFGKKEDNKDKGSGSQQSESDSREAGADSK